MPDIDLEELAEVARKNPRRMTKKHKQEMDATFLGMDFAELIKSGKVSVDVGNHFYTPSGDKTWVKEYIETNLGWSLFYNLPPDDVAALAKVIKDGAPSLDHWLRFRESCLFKCHQCGKDIGLETNGKEVRCYNPCEYPEGMPAYGMVLNVPSGKMVIANDMRSYFRVIGNYNINTLAGTRKSTEQYANVGMAFFYVGNTCPSVFKVNDKHYAIGTYGSQGQSPSKGSRRVAGICTDLWWYCVADYDEFIRRAGREPDPAHESVIRVVPGVWKFTHQHHKLPDDYRKPQLYSFVDWVGKPEPERDFLEEWQSLNYTAGQIIANDMIGRNATLSEIMSRADYLMCVNGSGVDYHPNGWMSGNPNLKPNLEVKIPTFNRRIRWYPQSKWSIIPRAAGIGEDIFNHNKAPVFLNPSFVQLAFNICRCILIYGVDSGASFREEKEAEKEEKSQVALMKKSIKGLAKIYPALVPQNCRELV